MITMTHLYTSRLDRKFLQYVGGVENNSFINIIQTDTDDDEHHHQSEIISNSPYYNTDDLITTFNARKNKLYDDNYSHVYQRTVVILHGN